MWPHLGRPLPPFRLLVTRGKAEQAKPTQAKASKARSNNNQEGPGSIQLQTVSMANLKPRFRFLWFPVSAVSVLNRFPKKSKNPDKAITRISNFVGCETMQGSPRVGSFTVVPKTPPECHSWRFTSVSWFCPAFFYGFVRLRLFGSHPL